MLVVVGVVHSDIHVHVHIYIHPQWVLLRHKAKDIHAVEWHVLLLILRHKLLVLLHLLLY